MMMIPEEFPFWPPAHQRRPNWPGVVVLALIALVTMAFLFTMAAFFHSACAAPPPAGSEQYNLMAPYSNWITGLRGNNNSPCCSQSDCRVVEFDMGGSGYRAKIDNKTFPGGPGWLSVPSDVVLHKPNPMAQALACWRRGLLDNFPTTNGFMCFVPGGGV